MGPKMVFWNTEFLRVTAYLTDSGSLAGGRGEENLLPDGRKSISQKKKSCCPWTLLTVQFEVYIFPLKKKSDCQLYIKKCHSVIFIHSPEIFVKA